MTVSLTPSELAALEECCRAIDCQATGYSGRSKAGVVRAIVQIEPMNGAGPIKHVTVGYDDDGEMALIELAAEEPLRV
jgi:hypothetical protein